MKNKHGLHYKADFSKMMNRLCVLANINPLTDDELGFTDHTIVVPYRGEYNLSIAVLRKHFVTVDIVKPDGDFMFYKPRIQFLVEAGDKYNRWIPISYRNDGLYTNSGDDHFYVWFEWYDKPTTPSKYAPRMQKSLLDLCKAWMVEFPALEIENKIMKITRPDEAQRVVDVMTVCVDFDENDPMNTYKGIYIIAHCEDKHNMEIFRQCSIDKFNSIDVTWANDVKSMMKYIEELDPEWTQTTSSSTVNTFQRFVDKRLDK